MGMYRDSDVLKKWDKHVGGHQLVRKLDENTNIIYAYSPGVPLISPRDFIYVAVRNPTNVTRRIPFVGLTRICSFWAEMERD
jgi:hypothetical protein